jgi:hypothetical protein
VSHETAARPTVQRQPLFARMRRTTGDVEQRQRATVYPLGRFMAGRRGFRRRSPSPAPL